MKLLFMLISLAIVIHPPIASAEVLGPCGTEDAQKPVPAVSSAAAVGTSHQIQRVLLPGEKAPNFNLSAIVGTNTIKKIKLSDFDGKWRVVCFYPADFTFV